MEHPLHLVHPYRHTAVLVLHDVAVYGQVGAGTVVLWPVELDAARYPWPRQSHECRLDDVVVIDEVALLDLIIRHLDATAQFRQHHYLEILVLQVHSPPFLRCRLVGYRLDDGIRINHATRALIYSLLQEDGILLCLSNLIRWYRHQLSPSFYHICILLFYLFTFSSVSSLSSSSRLLPFVSGHLLNRNKKAQTQMAL